MGDLAHTTLGLPAGRFRGSRRRLHLTTDAVAVEIFAPEREIKGAAFAAGAMEVGLLQIPPHGYAVLLRIAGWGAMDVVHSPLDLGRTDLFVAPEVIPERLEIVLADLDRTVRATRQHQMSRRFREALAAAELRAWHARDNFWRADWQAARRDYHNFYASIDLALVVAVVDRSHRRGALSPTA